MPLLSDLTVKPKPLEVPFGELKLTVEYKPLSYTVLEMEQISESKDVRQIVETIKRLVSSWDLKLAEDEPPVALDHPKDDAGRIADDDPLMHIPSHIFTELLRRVAEDQKPSGEAARSSRAS